jgi:hypothetical protein
VLKVQLRGSALRYTARRRGCALSHRGSMGLALAFRLSETSGSRLFEGSPLFLSILFTILCRMTPAIVTVIIVGQSSDGISNPTTRPVANVMLDAGSAARKSCSMTFTSLDSTAASAIGSWATRDRSGVFTKPVSIPPEGGVRRARTRKAVRSGSVFSAVSY